MSDINQTPGVTLRSNPVKMTDEGMADAWMKSWWYVPWIRWDMTIHANLGWRLKFMDGIWTTTEYHHWHHSMDRSARDRNYAGALPIMDILFGTYYMPKDKLPGPYGIEAHRPATYLGQLIQPFR